MADSKLSDLTAMTVLGGDELLYVVDDPSGTPLDRKITTANAKLYLGAGALIKPTFNITSTYQTALGSAGSNVTVLANYLYMTRVDIFEAKTFTSIAARCVTGSAGGTTCRLGIYNAAQTGNGLPTTVVADSGTISTSSSGALVTATISAALAAGTTYWLCALFEATPTMNGINPMNTNGTQMVTGGINYLGGLMRNNGSYAALSDQTGQTFVHMGSVGGSVVVVGIA